MIIALVILFLLISSPISQAISDFTTTQDISYQFNQQGIATVEHKISIQNNFAQFYPKEYSMSLSGLKTTDLQAFDFNGDIPIVTAQDNDTLKLSLL
jgi:hypothetical protein